MLSTEIVWTCQWIRRKGGKRSPVTIKEGELRFCFYFSLTKWKNTWGWFWLCLCSTEMHFSTSLSFPGTESFWASPGVLYQHNRLPFGSYLTPYTFSQCGTIVQERDQGFVLLRWSNPQSLPPGQSFTPNSGGHSASTNTEFHQKVEKEISSLSSWIIWVCRWNLPYFFKITQYLEKQYMSYF